MFSVQFYWQIFSFCCEEKTLKKRRLDKMKIFCSVCSQRLGLLVRNQSRCQQASYDPDQADMVPNRALVSRNLPAVIYLPQPGLTWPSDQSGLWLVGPRCSKTPLNSSSETLEELFDLPIKDHCDCVGHSLMEAGWQEQTDSFVLKHIYFFWCLECLKKKKQKKLTGGGWERRCLILWRPSRSSSENELRLLSDNFFLLLSVCPSVFLQVCYVMFSFFFLSSSKTQNLWTVYRILSTVVWNCLRDQTNGLSFDLLVEKRI